MRQHFKFAHLMRMIFIIISLSCFNTVFGQLSKTVIKSLKLFSCETGTIYQYKNHEIAVDDTWPLANDSSKFLLRTKITLADADRFKDIFSLFIRDSSDELLYNNCVNDGFNFKIYLYSDSIEKKILVGNYYDKRVDQLTQLFDKYLMHSGFAEDGPYTIGYRNNMDVEEMIKDQKLCDWAMSEDKKKHLLNNWCELEK
jgi:hypothetical protein